MGNYPAGQVNINVADFLKNPSRVERVVRDLTKEKTIADYAFGQGDAKDGAVVYDEVIGNPDEADRDVEVIAPGANFPEFSVLDEEQKMDKVSKYGGQSFLTAEAIRRNDVDTLNKRLQIVKNQIIKRVNKVTVNALVNHTKIRRVALTTTWDTVGYDVLGDIFAGKARIDDSDMGYTADLVLANPDDVQRYLLGRKDIREQLPKESKDLNPVLSGDLGNLCGVEWIKSATVPAGKLYIINKGISGSVRDEEGGVKTNVYETPINQRTYIQGWRSIVPIITDPLSVVELSGFAA